MEDLKCEHLILGVNNSLNSVFKSFFIHKILVHQKKFQKNPKNSKKSEKIQKIRKIPKKSEKSEKN